MDWKLSVSKTHLNMTRNVRRVIHSSFGCFKHSDIVQMWQVVSHVASFPWVKRGTSLPQFMPLKLGQGNASLCRTSKVPSLLSEVQINCSEQEQYTLHILASNIVWRWGCGKGRGDGTQVSGCKHKASAHFDFRVCTHQVGYKTDFFLIWKHKKKTLKSWRLRRIQLQPLDGLPTLWFLLTPPQNLPQTLLTTRAPKFRPYWFSAYRIVCMTENGVARWRKMNLTTQGCNDVLIHNTFLLFY